VRRFFIIVGILVCVFGAGIALLLPPSRRMSPRADWTLTWPVVRGAYHVHSVRSDGAGSVDDIAGAAARAGLQFVIITDHGTGARDPEPPSYRSGVLCVDGVEISTADGHYVALGLPRTPYPLGGYARDVIDDVRRLGGFGFAAHPDSAKPELRWQAWNAPFDGLEWLNADSEWRDELWGSLGRGLLTYAFRPVETLAGLLDRPAPVIDQWDRLTSRRRVPGIAGADAHARLGFRDTTEPYDNGLWVRLPSYEASFAAFANHVVLNSPLTGNAAADAVLVLDSLREGRIFTSIEGLAALGRFEARATSGSAIARIGEWLDLRGPAVIDARISAPEGTILSVVRDGTLIYEVTSQVLRVDVGHQPGAYRIEARLPARSQAPTVPWILSNPIYIGLRDEHAKATMRDAPRPAIERATIPLSSWQPEACDQCRSAAGQAALADGTAALDWQWALADAPRRDQYAALRWTAQGGLARHDRLQLRAMSDKPARMWIQLRAPVGGAAGERWAFSVYVGPSLETNEVRFADFRPLGPVSSAAPALDRVDSVLLVIDTLHTPPGTSGRLLIPEISLVK